MGDIHVSLIERLLAEQEFEEVKVGGWKPP